MLSFSTRWQNAAKTSGPNSGWSTFINSARMEYVRSDRFRSRYIPNLHAMLSMTGSAIGRAVVVGINRVLMVGVKFTRFVSSTITCGKPPRTVHDCAPFPPSSCRPRPFTNCSLVPFGPFKTTLRFKCFYRNSAGRCRRAISPCQQIASKPLRLSPFAGLQTSHSTFRTPYNP